MRNRNAGEKPEGVEGGNSERKVAMGKWLIISVKSKTKSAKCKVQIKLHFAVCTLHLEGYT